MSDAFCSSLLPWLASVMQIADIGVVLFGLKYTALELEPQEVVDAHPPDPVGNRQGNHYGETEDKDVRQYLGSGNFKLISLGYSS